MTPSQREFGKSVLLFVVGVFSLALVLGCSDVRTPTGPSVAPVASSAIVTPVAAEPVPAPTPSPAPPIAATPTPSAPAIPARPFARTDCDYSNLSAVRCYNPSDQTIVLSAGVIVSGAAGCNLNWAGKHENVVIPPRSNGYFTLPGPTCAVYQLDFFFGATVGRCLNPDFTAERTYASTTGCAPPPPPPPVCIDPAWGPWINVVTPAQIRTHPGPKCRQEQRTRTLCNGTVESETRTVCQ